MKKVTIIIPNHNGFKYSENCFKALENQTFKDFSVCVIDDCSTDDSVERLNEFAKSSPLDLEVIALDENMGPGHARKLGIQQTKSEWVAFCDIDDWYDEDFLEQLLVEAESSGADLVMCDHKYIWSNGEVSPANSMDWSKEVTSSKQNILAYARMSLWRLLAKRSLFEGIVIPEIYYGEDAPVVIQLIANADNIFVDVNARYNYLVRSGSASTNANPKVRDDYIAAFNVIEKSISDIFPEEAEFIGINMILYGVTLIMLKNRQNASDLKKIINRFVRRYPEWTNNKYLKNLDRKKKIYLCAIKWRCLFLNKIYSRLHSYIINKQR